MKLTAAILLIASLLIFAGCSMSNKVNYSKEAVSSPSGNSAAESESP